MYTLVENEELVDEVQIGKELGVTLARGTQAYYSRWLP
jgi:hypothetical protein